jgi:hypothetical protein
MGAGEVSAGSSDPATMDPKTKKSPASNGAPVPGQVYRHTPQR